MNIKCMVTMSKKFVSISMDKELVEKINAERGLVSFSAWINEIIKKSYVDKEQL